MDYRMEKPGMELRPSLLGYGCMRFPRKKDRTVDEEKVAQLIHRAMESGVTYYDTAWFYHDGESEPILGRILSQYPRESYYLATKMPCAIIDSLEQAKDIFAKQMERLQMDHFDFYLLHSLSGRSWKKMLELGVVDFLEQCHREGKFRWFGFSFHDEYEAFEEILRARNWDFCQIQLNYMDRDIQAGLRGHDLALELGVPLVIMEPVKGGLLAQPPEEVLEPLRALDPNATPSSWAMRWVGSLPGVKVVLSGMSSMEQLEDNLSTFSNFRPLSEEERAAVDETAHRLAQRVKNGCTGCRYCMPCPAGVDIPKSFRIWNRMEMYQNYPVTRYSWREMPAEARPDQCYRCGRCERLCPQHLPIRAQLAQAQEEITAFVEKR